ncbi:MAG: YCF48-related protein, partial [Zavarzinia sp.]|nr:YCF48-related protein [Zavarzinia sp.]
MAAFIALVAVYAFYPRSLPDYPATATNPSRLRINGLAQAGDRLVAVGESGHVLISDDGAKSWRDGTVLSGAGVTRVDSTLTNVRFLGKELGFVVGHDGLVMRSTDEGASWTPIRFDEKYSDPLFDLCRSSTGTIVVVGSFGRLLTSTDKGDSFEQVDLDETLPDGPHLNDVACAGDGRVLAVGEFAQALRSRDGGATWEALQLPYNGSLYGVVQATNDRWIAFGMLGHVFTTDDFGDSWTEVKPGIETSLFGGLKLADGRVVLYG